MADNALIEADAAQDDGDDDGRTIAEAFLETTQTAIEDSDVDGLNEIVEELHPADLADLIGHLDEEERAAFMGLLGGRLPSEVLPELDASLTEEVVSAMTPAAVAEAVVELDTDDAAFILEELDEAKRAEILAEVPIASRIALHQAFDYEEESAGRIMQREVFAAPGYWTVGQIIDRMRGSSDLPDVFYEVFVIDPGFRPVGAVPLSTLLKTPRDVTIDEIMDEDIRSVPVDMDQEEVGYLFERYNLISTPVVDGGGRLVGMITVDDVVEIVQEETGEDMLALAGVEADSGLSDSVGETVRSRFSWLAVNLGTAILASFVISLFDAAIAKVVALAVLMPIVASMGGNAGTQTLTVAVRALATRSLTPSNAARIVWREAQVGFLNGAMFAVIMGGLAGAWYAATSGDTAGAARLGVVVGAAMVINLLAAGLAGILVPIALQRAGQDPAVSSAVFVTTVTDIVGFAVFLGLAAAVLM
ncbi:MAG: magnesium transporter [Alphaproteobacteria bacterium]|nr:magnesium transporter [Alphaproteobacteria bacterium]